MTQLLLNVSLENKKHWLFEVMYLTKDNEFIKRKKIDSLSISMESKTP